MSIDVFLSHNSKDKPAIRELKTELQRVGLSTWLDEDDLVAGQPWLDAIEVAIKSAKSIVVAIGSSGLGPWETPEMRSALI
ncbi:MAG: toll/interleukin-1 receptor domain-containing protein, partial [Pirellula sp.]